MKVPTPVLHAAVITTGVVVLFWFGRRGPWTPMRIAGAALMLGGYLGWLSARLQLGGSFAIQPRAKELVTRGVYSKIRNPIYVFGSLLIIGILLYISRPIWLLTFVVLIPLQVWRAHKEAKVLEEKFGEAYREYRKKTWF